MTNKVKRKIAIRDFYGKGKHIYEDQMGFDEQQKSQARSLVAREVFRYHVETIGLNLGFYYPPTDTFYAIYNDARPVEVYTMPSGHKIVFAHKQGGMVNISTWVKTGSINENEEINGISHFLEHLMFKGTHKHKAGEFDKTLEAYGAIVNAATWKDYTFYYVTLP